MRNNHRKATDIWQEQISRVEVDKRILLITAYLQEIKEFPETMVPEVKARQVAMQIPF